MNNLLFYCRAGFESDLATEVQEKAALHGVYGYTDFKSNTGFVLYHCYQADEAYKLAKTLKLSDIVFARQMIVCSDFLSDLNSEDRISDLLTLSADLPFCGELRAEYPDTTAGRELSKFCRKFSVPFRQALRKRDKLSNNQLKSRPVLHVFFTSNNQACLGYSYPDNNSPYELGILRLKFPHQAPSRSTLKLDEAFQLFLSKEEQEKRLLSGMHAVDLGACPGGWTYQLVRRGMFVQAIDNGAMDESLMETGLVSYFAEDGFKYEPRKKNVHWLVCDMVEQPQRVAKLMAQWVVKGWCKEAMFNLKLPMKKRHQSVQEALEVIQEVMKSARQKYHVQAKHLYHDREEITLHLRLQ